MRIGSLCSGIGGLELGLKAIQGGSAVTIRELRSGDSQDQAMTREQYWQIRDSDPRPWPEPVNHLLAAILEAPDETWRSKAACKGMTHLFFPEGSKRSTYGPARQICDGCPVRAECAESGADEVHGVWGGLSPNQRRAARVPRRFDPKVRAEGLDLARTGMSDPEVAERVGVHPRTVQKWRYAAGVKGTAA